LLKEWIFLIKNSINEIFRELNKRISSSRVLIDEPLAKHTTFKIGGPADFLVLPESMGEVSQVLQVAREYEVSLTILGNGSNVLVLDKGIRGIVLKIDSGMSYIKNAGSTVIAGAGALLADVSNYAATQQFCGLEFAIGIPGSLGGAVFMNAGAYSGEIGQVVSAVSAVCPDGRFQRFERSELEFGYRHSVFQDNHCVICEVEMALQVGEQDRIQSTMSDYTMRRESKQPLEMPSAGSTFKRPPGHFAGTLIEQAGLKGFTVGGAQVSMKHAGFVVNAGGATAGDVLNLIKEVQLRVYRHSGVMLQPEVRIIGEE
jgi:UDP-N-acetylmuramate dehydrogenase